MAKSCKGLANELVKCLSESDCVKVENRPFRDCAKEQSPSISSECVGLRETYFNCKRGQKKIGNVLSKFELLFMRTDKSSQYYAEVDMRARIRGNKGY